MRKTKRLAFALAAIVAITGGVSVGAYASTPNVVKADSGCNMECELGMSCQPNVGGNTYCAREDDSNECKTRGCAEQ